jgi:quercetin dioxygenase-like cupin family protein
MVSILSATAFCFFSQFVSAADIQRKPLQNAEIFPAEDSVVLVTELVLPPGASIPRHTHPGDEFLYVLEGGIVMTKSGDVISFKSGMSDHFPRGKVHGGFTVSGDQALKVLTTHIVDRGVPLVIPAPE